MKEEQQDTCSTGSSMSGIYKSFFKSQTPVCMFYFSHPFGISTPSSETRRNTSDTKRTRKNSRYTTTTYLVTEIQKNHSDGSQDECEMQKNSAFNDRELLPWPKNFLLPPLIQMIEKKHGRKLPDIDAILKQVRKQAWNTPKSHHTHSFWSRDSSISSDDFSSLASPDSLNDKTFSTKIRLRRKVRKAHKMESSHEKSCGNSGSNSSHGKAILLKRRYSVPEIIMRKYSLAQQKSYEESTSIFSTTTSISDTITKRNNNGQSTTAINNSGKKQIQSQTPPSRTASPIKYFIPLSPQQQSSNMSSTTISNSTTFGGSGGFFHNGSEISMRKQTLLRRMWSREFQHSKYSGSWTPPLRKSTHHNTQSRLKKFNTLPEFISSSCEKCKELGVLSRDIFDEDLCESKEDKSQQTDLLCETNVNVAVDLAKQKQILSSASSSASTIIQSSDIVSGTRNIDDSKKEAQTSSIKNSSSSSSSSIIDSNGNNIIICMTAVQEQQNQHQHQQQRIDNFEGEEMLQVEIDGNNNNSAATTTTTSTEVRNGDKYLKKQFSTQLEDEGYHPSDELTDINYRRLREERLSETEIDQYISQMLIDNLNNVIKTVNENLQANGESNLVKIDYSNHPSSEVVETFEEQNVLYNGNNKLRNQHEIAIQMRNAKNGDNDKNRNSNESMSPTNYNYVAAAVEHGICENTDVNSPKLVLEHFENNNNNIRNRHYFSSYVDNKSVSERSTSTDHSDHQQQQLEVTAIINTGTSYPHLNRPESILVPRVIGPKTESMEVNPSSSSAQDDDEFDGVPDSDEEDISDVDSLDDIVTIKAKKLNELAHQQHKKAQALFRQTHLKGQAFFVPIVDTEQPIDEHIVVADTMPEKLKERLVLRQRRRDMKKQSEMKIKQWQMQKFIERKMEQMNVVNEYLADLSTTGGAFKIIGMPSKQTPIETNVYRRASNQFGGNAGVGWVPKQRISAPVMSNSNQSGESTSEKSTTTKSKKLRNEIGMLESYKIDARGNMQIQPPKKQEKPPKPKIKRTSYTSISEGKKSSKGKLKTPSEPMLRKSIASSKRTSNIPTSSASSVENIDARRRQIMKDVQQMSVYKNDLTPDNDPDIGPSRKMWKTEIQEGDKHIEILEIVECVDGNTLAQQAQNEHNNNNNNNNHNNNNFNHLFTSTPSNNTQNHHKFYHIPSSSSSQHHPMYVNKTFSVKTSGFDDAGRHYTASRIPVPVYTRQMRYRQQQPFIHYEPRDTSPSNHLSSSTDADESLTSTGSSINQQSSKVDRMIANLLMEALKSPEDLGIEFIKSPNIRRMKRRSQSPAGADSTSSTGYYTGDSSSRRSASNSAGKYHHRFEVIPEEKSSFSVDSSNDDFNEDEDDEKNEKLNNINSDWKSKKNLQNNDIKTRNIITPQKQESESIAEENRNDNDDEEEKENVDGKEEEKSEKSKSIKSSSSPMKKSPSKQINNNTSSTNNHLKTPSTTAINKSAKSSPVRSSSSPIKSIKSNIKSTNGAESVVVSMSPPQKKPVATEDKDASETKSFVMFTDENEAENENGNVDAYEKDVVENDGSSTTALKSEADTFHSEHHHNNLIHQFMNNKNSSCSSTSFNNISSNNTDKNSNNNHFHYHLYQYQTNHCCFNLLDHSKSSSTVTTAASTHENCSNCHLHSAANSCPLGVTDITMSLNASQCNDNSNKDDSEKSKVSIDESIMMSSLKFNNNINENATMLNSSGSEFPSTAYGLQPNSSNNKLNCPSSDANTTATPTISYDNTAATSRMHTADEKIIEIELSNELLRKPQEERDNDDCSCTKKYLPYKVNEKNVWQVYETSDCKYIHSKYEIDEVFQPPISGDSTLTSENCNLLHSRSNFSNQVICHSINHEAKHGENENVKTDSVNINTQTSQKSFNSSTNDSFYMPTFNIKPVNVSTACQCNNNHHHEEAENVSKVEDEDDDDNDDESVIISNQSTSISTREVFTNGQQTGKLLNRPKATNNISRDQVKPVEKEIQNEITHGGMKSSGNNTNAFKTSSSHKPIRLPSPVPKQQQRTSPPKRNNSYEDNSNSSNESSSSSVASQCGSPKHSKAKSVDESASKGKSKTNRENSLIKPENKSVAIPNIHQGWSVTVAGTHLDLAPDVEMKISFPKPKGASQSASVITSEASETHKPESEIFYYKNNQLMPPPPLQQQTHNQSNQMQYDIPKPYYNKRRSLSLARIDSGMSGMIKPKSYHLPNLHVPRPTARNAFKQVECTTISASKTIIPSRRSLSLDVGNRNRRASYDSRSQASPFTPSEMLSVVGSEIKKTLKPKVKTMSERDLTKRHLNCFTRNNGHIF